MADKAKDSGPTKRVVLRRERVLVLPDGVDETKIAEACKILGVKGKMPDVRRSLVAEAWVVVDDGEGSKTQAIEAHAGKPGTPDAKVGVYKAPNASSWAGGEIYDAPPKPLVQRRALEDDAA